MINELDLVVLTKEIPEYQLCEGDIGTVVLVHKGGTGFEVEFAMLDGASLGVVTVDKTAVGLVSGREIAHVRQVA